MLYFPQLSSGAIGQYPTSRSLVTRTVTNIMAGGDAIRMADTGAAMVRWHLSYTGLSDAEAQSLTQTFCGAQGRLNAFTFLDPTDNLLLWTEDWTKPEWVADPLLTVSGGSSDPTGGTGAVQLTNTAQTMQGIRQKLAAAGWFRYCFSVYLRADLACSAQLQASCTDAMSTTTVAVGPSWARVSMATSLSSQADEISFGLALPGGSRMNAFGPQVEAQPAAGLYKKNTDQAGVYPNTHFAADELSMSADGVNQGSCTFELESRLSLA